MPSIKMKINANVLQWAISNSNTDEFLLRALFPKIDEWLSGNVEPTFNQLENLSRKLHIPFGYLLLNSPPKEKVELLEFRTIESEKIKKPSRELIDTIYDMEMKMDWMREELIRLGNEPMPFVNSISKSSQDIKNIASIIRKDIELDDDWFLKTKNADESFKYIRSKLEDLGVLVMMNGIVGSNTSRSLDVNEFRAFVIIDDYAPLIFINAKDSSGGRLFSICHELAHIWFGENNIFNDQYDSKDSYKDKLELKCNAIAAEILVPEKHFMRKWQEDSTEKISEKIKALAKYFRVSETVIARRALDFGKITKQEYSTIYKMAIENFNKMIDSKKKRSGGDYYSTAKTRIDHRFFSVVNRSVLNGTLKYTDAFRLTGLNRKTYSEFERRL